MNTSQFDARPGLAGDEGGPGITLDLTGYTVEARDGVVGRVLEYATDHLVIDTDLFGNTATIPIEQMGPVDHQNRVIHIDRDREALRLDG